MLPENTFQNFIDGKHLDAIKVQFRKKIVFEDDFPERDFPERGMTAWLTQIKFNEDGDMQLFFDFSDFEDINAKYFTETYFPNRHTPIDTGRMMFTAIEAGYYTKKYTVYLTPDNPSKCGKTIAEHLAIIE